ncbi:MAG: hypothetical protein JXQ90_15975 [Cyclobacteriaceae bacterium]
MNKIEFELFGLHLMEPMAFILNIALTATNIHHFLQLRKLPQTDLVKYWNLFFLFFGIGTFCAAFGHTFYYYWGITGKMPTWTTGFFAISAAEWAMISLQPSTRRKWMQTLSLAKLAASLVVFIIQPSFNWVIIHSSIGFIFFIAIPSAIRTFKGDTFHRYFAIGVLVLIVSLPVRLLGIDFHLWFNRDDIGHVLMFITLMCFLQGTRDAKEYSVKLSPSLSQ